MSMWDKVNTLWPEIILLATAFGVMLIGLAPRREIRRSVGWLTALGMVVAAAVAGSYLFSSQYASDGDAMGSGLVFQTFVRLGVLGVGLLLLLMAAELPDEYGAGESEKGFDPSRVSRGEFFGFFLLSITGAMLCAAADDLIWLFLALELTSLPTYVMVATTRRKSVAPEAGVKYFFLGAFAAAVFLYGFALIYGATGATGFAEIADQFRLMTAADPATGQIGELSGMALLGLVLAITGVCFKIAAFPMHAYAADVYQGAATPVTAFLAFVPKTAGFVTLIVLLGLVGWPLQSQALIGLLGFLAVATMFLGNTLALLQHNVKRVLAYSSIAHSGYMLIGLTAGIVVTGSDSAPLGNGLGAVLFYLVAYGVMNLGAFAVLGLLKAAGQDAETFDDLRGLVRREPVLATVMAICALSLAGFPPVIGFWGKAYLFGSAISAEMIWLVVFGVINSAIAAVYYLRIVGVCFLAEPDERVERSARPVRSIAAIASAILVVILSFAAEPLMDAAHDAAQFTPDPDHQVAHVERMVTEATTPDAR